MWTWWGAVCAVLPLITAAQVQWTSHPVPLSTTLVDALSADPDYTSLIRLLQRARLIPTLNRLNASTFFAPTNDAIERHAARDSLWRAALGSDDENLLLDDNRHEELRQQLFYHLLNYSLPDPPNDSSVQVHKTLLFPRSPVELPSPDPPPLPPWMPVPGGTLGGEPQRLRISSQDGGIWVGVNAFGESGAQIVKERVNADNGILLGISSVLDTPPDLATAVSQHDSVSYLNKIISPQISKFLNDTANLTLFLPIDEAWASLHPLERLYLESEFSANDLLRIVNMHAVVDKSIKWSDSFKSGINLTTLEGTDLEIAVSPNKTTVSHAVLVHPDIYASNGVLHVVDSLLIPNGTLQLTAEKYLLALNCTSFVSLMHSVNLTSFINNTDAKYTILAPRDDVLSVFGSGELPEEGSDDLRALLQYHFLPGRWTPEKLKDGMLVETALDEPGLKGERQVLNIEVNREIKKPIPWKGITFAGVGVIDDPIEINNTIIYFVSRPLTPPLDSLQTALPHLDLSSFLAAVFSASLAETLKTTPRTTLLIPHNTAFKRIGQLVSEHLLSASSKPDLERLILHHTIEGVEYASELLNGTLHSYPTLEGSDISIFRQSNGSVFVGASGGWAGTRAGLRPHNRLTRTGVIHELTDLLLPRSIELTVGKLMRAAKGATMASLVTRVGMDWILNGTNPPDDSEWAGMSGVGWTLLCPTDEAFKDVNLTMLHADLDGMRDIVRQHLIPSSSPNDRSAFDILDSSDNMPVPINSGATFSTLLTPSSPYGDVIFRMMDDDKSARRYVVGIKGARGTNGKTDWASVLTWGRSTTGQGTGGVIQINRLLVPYYPPWWSALYGGPGLVLASGMVLICLFFYVVSLIWRRDTTEATYEPIGGFGRDDED